MHVHRHKVVPGVDENASQFKIDSAWNGNGVQIHSTEAGGLAHFPRQQPTLSPTQPQKEEGIRMEPPPSVPEGCLEVVSLTFSCTAIQLSDYFSSPRKLALVASHSPIAMGQIPAAMSAALPLEEPPVYRPGSCRRVEGHWNLRCISPLDPAEG